MDRKPRNESLAATAGWGADRDDLAIDDERVDHISELGAALSVWEGGRGWERVGDGGAVTG